MANELTGDFDVVAEFAIPAANRVLAAMHRSERFLHSIAIRVDDNSGPGSPKDHPIVVGSLDAFGDPTVDHTRIGTITWPGASSAPNPLHAALDLPVNGDVVVATVGPLVPSQLQGRAQLQLSPPTIDVPDGSGTNLRVQMNVMSRYFPDPQTPPVAEFIRGDLRITAAVNQVSSQTANIVDIDIKANTVVIDFTPTWSDRPLSAEDRAGIIQAIRNALKTSFVPTNATLPSSIAHMQFKTFLGPPSALGVLLDMDGGPGHPGSATNVFLRPGDDFAFAVGREFIVDTFNAAVQLPPQFTFEFDMWFFGQRHVVYTVTPSTATVELQSGQILISVQGHAHTDRWWLPDFSFRARLPFWLSLAGATADLVPGAISLEITTGGIKGWLVSLFKDRALPEIVKQRDDLLAQTRDTVRHRLNADENLGSFLKSLLNTARRRRLFELQAYSLAYTSAEIRQSGIVLHGSLAVMDWPPARVEFEEIPVNPGSGHHGVGGLSPRGPDYSALRTWIPGGTIQRYEWKHWGAAQPFSIDDHKFVYLQPPVLSPTEVAFRAPGMGFNAICLTVRGQRISASGPAVLQPVTASVCGYGAFPVVGDLSVEARGALPLIALTYPGAGGLVEVAGHTAARRAEPGRGAPNLLVHFADDKTAGQLGFLPQALRDSERTDALTAILAVLSAEQMARARHIEDVLYAEDQAGAWVRVFGVKTTRRPLTLIVAPNGKVVWQHEGELASDTLAAALGRGLVPRSAITMRVLRPAVTIGQFPPDFLFEHTPGRALRLRNLQGRPATLVFWKSAAKVSLETVRQVQSAMGRAEAPRPVVLAINDGDPAELAKRVAAQHGLSVVLVTDPERRISLTYGVNIWPTIVTIDALGLVRELRYGRVGEAHAGKESAE